MVERVTIEGEGLTVTTTAPDPKRRRPPPYNPPTVEHTGRTLLEILGPNPYWTEEENRDAEQEG